MKGIVGKVYCLITVDGNIVAGVYAQYKDQVFVITETGERKIIRMADIGGFAQVNCETGKMKKLQECTDRSIAHHWAEKLGGKSAEIREQILSRLEKSVEELRVG